MSLTASAQPDTRLTGRWLTLERFPLGLKG